MNWFKASNWLDVGKHIGYIISITIVATLIFFYIYLPFSTNHGETITVPDVIGVSHESLDQFLIRRNLRYEITKDSSYSPDLPPLSVLKQFPLPNSKVKENRKIYITLNSQSPPKVRMPDLIEGSLINAQNVLKTYDLKIGKIEYSPELYFNTVLKQKLNGMDVSAGEMIPKGSTIDLVLADGLGNQKLESPRLIGLDAEDATVAILGSGLKIGEIKYELSNLAVIKDMDSNGEETITEINVSPGVVTKQRPESGTPMKLQQKVDIWVYKPDSLNISPSILDL